MAAASISFDLREIDEVRKMLAAAALDTSDRQRLLQSIGVEMETQTKERFQTQKSPDGDSWKALAEKTKAYYARKRKSTHSILNFEGGLLDSLTHDVQDGAMSVLVGSNKVYAATHQFGRGKIPERPYLGVSPSDAKEIAAIATAYLAGGLR